MEVEDNPSFLYGISDSYENIAVYEEHITESEELWHYCILESVISITKNVTEVLCMNIAFGMILSFGLSEWLFHLISFIIGVYSLSTMSQNSTGMCVVFICFLSAYQILLTDLKIARREFQNKIVKWIQKVSLIDHGLVFVLCLLQYVILDPLVWSNIQGTMMVFIMKMMSLSHDIKTQRINTPNIYEFMGYLFCGTNVIFGPWISYDRYMEQLIYPTRKTYWWIVGVLRAYGISIFFLVTSNCLTNYFIPDNSNRLLVGYKEALTYRTSHYFISFLSEAMMLAAGWKNTVEWFDEKQWHFTVTEPMEIEFPSHLAAVVVKWNMPMHTFLKKYIYKKWICHGRFWAILMTFVMSSLFHGFEIKVSVVLISIGLFSYMQILVRDKIAKLFNCCVKVRSCEVKYCKHYYKQDGWFCKTLKIIFGILTILHLIFLGILMDPTTDRDGIYKKWEDLEFFSLWIMLFNISFITVLKIF